MGIKKVVTHKNPHIDELSAYVVLQLIGKKEFPGIDSAVLETLERKEISSKSFKEWLKQGILVIGAGGDGFEFDEHQKNRDKNNSCLRLVLRRFGLEEDPLFRYLLKYVTTNDSGFDQHPFSLGNVLKEMYFNYPEQKVIDFGLAAVRSKLLSQTEFLLALKEAQKAKVRVISKGDFAVKVVWLRSDNRQIVRALYYQDGLAANVGIVERNGGSKVVFVNKVFPNGFPRSNKLNTLLLRILAKDIREAELKARGINLKFSKEIMMSDKGPDVLPMWYKLRNNLFLNTDYEPSKLSLDEIKNIVLSRIKSLIM